MMTATEEELMARSTSQSNSLILLFLAGSLSGVPVCHADCQDHVAHDVYDLKYSQQDPSSRQFVSIEESDNILDSEIIDALLQVHKALAVDQNSLDPESENLLREHLSDLYL